MSACGTACGYSPQCSTAHHHWQPSAESSSGRLVDPQIWLSPGSHHEWDVWGIVRICIACRNDSPDENPMTNSFRLIKELVKCELTVCLCFLCWCPLCLWLEKVRDGQENLTSSMLTCRQNDTIFIDLRLLVLFTCLFHSEGLFSCFPTWISLNYRAKQTK